MAGTAVDQSTYQRGQPYEGTTSSTTNEVDVISGFPTWCRHVEYYTANAARVGHPGSGVKTTASTLTDADPHKPLPVVATYYTEPFSGADVYISCTTVSNAYKIILHEAAP